MESGPYECVKVRLVSQRRRVYGERGWGPINVVVALLKRLPQGNHKGLPVPYTARLDRLHEA